MKFKWKITGILADADKHEISGTVINAETGERAWFKSPTEGQTTGTPEFLSDLKKFVGRNDAGVCLDIFLLHTESGRPPAEHLKECGL